MADDGVNIHSGIAYANHDGVELLGDLYLPRGAKAAPALVAVHGGGWVQGVRTAFQYWGPYLAAHGIALFSISYRLAAKSKTYPQAVHDVLAGVQFTRGKAGEFGIDAARIGLIGASAGAHLAALAALGWSSGKFSNGYPRDAFASVDAGVKALVGVYGIYDVPAMWTDLSTAGRRRQQHPKIHGRAADGEPAALFRRLADQLRDIRQQQDRRPARHRHRGRLG